MLVSQLFEQYLKNKTGVLTYKTLYNMRQSVLGTLSELWLRNYEDLGRDEFLEIHSKIAAKSCTDSTKLRDWSYVKTLANFAEFEYSIENKVKGLPGFKVRARHITSYIERNYIGDFFTVVDDFELYVLFALYFATATRLGELTALLKPDIDLLQRRFTVEKTCSYNCGGGLGYKIEHYAKTGKSVSMVYIPSWIVPLLQKLMNSSKTNYVFYNFGNDEPIRAGRIRYQLKRYCRMVGLPEITPQGLRKSCACYLDDCALPIRNIAGWLRHSNTRTTERYYLDRRPCVDSRTVQAVENMGLMIENSRFKEV